ncbi:MAG: magnesium transporter CorA family protein [Spirochaetes bacterium]|uniref:Magnesium transporter CorA family protein n=1 Tax=Candidatus Avitreponema avistercoris TaxID=2840705 RepID=A0A9D9EQU5_9SPIR|nr:magnesium transporter CorA family protein [Candidatus Avitreponema avistercoris]
MIRIWKQENGKLVEGAKTDSPVWVDARNVTQEDIKILEREYNIETETIVDILDQDELSRLDWENDYVVVIVRLPVFLAESDISYTTTPLGIILYPDKVITICWTDGEVLHDMATNRVRNLSLDDLPSFVIQVLARADLIFLRYLKAINRNASAIQTALQKSVRNLELMQLLNLEKSLVYFSTSLKSNQLLFEKLMRTRLIQMDEEDRDWLEDVAIDNRQAIEMADVYTSTMSGTMDTFASVISNNLSITMKKLTVISLVLMIPTMVTSFFGMNIPLPTDSWGGNAPLLVILGVCVLLSGAASVLLRDKRKKKRTDSAWGRLPRLGRKRRE